MLIRQWQIHLLLVSQDTGKNFQNTYYTKTNKHADTTEIMQLGMVLGGGYDFRLIFLDIKMTSFMDLFWYIKANPSS